MNPDQTQPGKRNVPWLAIILAVLALVALIAGSDRGGRGIVPMMRESMGIGAGSMQQVGGSPSVSPSVSRDTSISDMIGRPDYYPNGEVPATDTREFLKTDYYATMQTRHVQDLVRRAETTVRGYEGRIDNISSSEKNGYIQFVVPMSKFQNFRDELEGLVGARFLSVQISSQNLLPQKQSIEEVQKSVEKTLADLKSARQKAITAYNAVASNLETQLNSVQQEINALGANPTDPSSQARLATLSATLTNLQTRLSSEKAAHLSKLASYDNQIKNAGVSLTAVQNQDQNLLDTVATVRGSISIQWISLWDIARLYLPGPSIPLILGALAILAYMYDRRLYFFKNF